MSVDKNIHSFATLFPNCIGLSVIADVVEIPATNERFRLLYDTKVASFCTALLRKRPLSFGESRRLYLDDVGLRVTSIPSSS